MRAYVLTDKALTRHAGRFVWLAIDGEKAKNAPFRKQFPIPAFPTYFVLDPTNERVMMRWVGGASVGQLDRMLDEQSAAFAGRSRGATSRTPLVSALARADSLYGALDYPGAAAAYGAALASAPAGWPEYSRAVESRLFALSEADSADACATLAEQAWPRLERTVSAANVAGSGLECALQLPATASNRAARVAAFERDCREVLADPTLKLTGDDRSGLYISLLDARDDAHDSLGHRDVAEQWSACLDAEAAKAKTPEARAVYDPHRLSAYIEIGHAERAIPMLELSEREFPNDYNPPARLAVAFKTLHRWDEALAASDRAMSKAYGPRKLLFYQNRADIYAGRGDAASARKTLEEAVRYANALPDGQRSKSTIASLQKKLDAMR